MEQEGSRLSSQSDRYQMGPILATRPVVRTSLTRRGSEARDFYYTHDGASSGFVCTPCDVPSI